MAEKKIKAECSFGMVWFGGWLFTLGYLGLGFWKGVWAIIAESIRLQRSKNLSLPCA
ncbi:MAG: hypothetical protein P8X69_01405 [Maritimibacter sp.]